MIINAWSIQYNGFDESSRYSRDALFLVGNGLLGVRGFFEEDNRGISALGGIYMSGIYGKGEHKVCEGQSRELCNLPNFLQVHLLANSEDVYPEKGTQHTQKLDMQNGVFSRCYFIKTKRGTLDVRFERFASMANANEVWQKITITCVNGTVDTDLTASISTGVTNLNLISSEPLPVQPGRSHFKAKQYTNENTLHITLDDPDETQLTFFQHATCTLNGNLLPAAASTTVTRQYAAGLQTGDTLCFERVVCVNTTSLQNTNYSSALAAHSNKWAQLWQQSDIQLNAPEKDNGILRFNLFHLLQANPRHSSRQSIGARGLSGEMYEGCVFWDTEIFQLPFFIYTDPASAKRLLLFRYHTLNQAKNRAKSLWFEGAMYPWQVSDNGLEQTGENVGAFYSVHICADIAYAVMLYLQTTGDTKFLVDGGFEILVETARFWKSRCDFSEQDGQYHIFVVRGPNEYDVVVDDNAYTNTLAAKNLLAVEKAAMLLEKHHPAHLQQLLNRLALTTEERSHFTAIANNMYLPQLEKDNLLLEDSRYHLRRPINLAKAKHGGKRIIDSTIPYEALPLYQVSKQADVLQLMNLYPDDYTHVQKETAYNYYEPRTAHDSSLSYAPHSLMASTLGKTPNAWAYYQKSALLDVENRQLNTVSGLHYANFGGTWQAAYHGFLGIQLKTNKLHIAPCLPKHWHGFKTSCCMQGQRLNISLQNNTLSVSGENISVPITVALCGTTFTLNAQNPSAAIQLKESISE